MGGRLGGWDWLVQFLRISAKLNYNLSINMGATFTLYYIVYYIIMYYIRYIYLISAKLVSSIRSSYSELILHPPRLFIGPESDHWLPISLTDWLIHSMTFSRLENATFLRKICRKCQFFALNLKKFTPAKKIYTRMCVVFVTNIRYGCPSVLNNVSTDVTLIGGEDWDTWGLKPIFPKHKWADILFWPNGRI